MATSLDLSEVYDKIDWGYLNGIMEKMGFSEVWVKLIMTCIMIVSYSMLMNDKHGNMFHPSRGIR